VRVFVCVLCIVYVRVSVHGRALACGCVSVYVLACMPVYTVHLYSVQCALTLVVMVMFELLSSKKYIESHHNIHVSNLSMTLYQYFINRHWASNLSFPRLESCSNASSLFFKPAAPLVL